MNLRDFKVLADENIQSDVIKFLSSENFDIVSVFDLNLQAKPDIEIISYAVKSNRIIITHDADFGKIIFTSDIKYKGIIFLRPGHILSEFTIHTINTLLKQDLELAPPFILIAEQIGDKIKIRLRNNL